MEEVGEGGTLIFSRYISWADFWGSNFLNFNIHVFFFHFFFFWGGGVRKSDFLGLGWRIGIWTFLWTF